VVIAAPLLLFHVVVRFRQDGQQAQRKRLCVAIVCGALVWAPLRWWLATRFQLTTGTTSPASLGAIQDSLGWNFAIVFLDIFKVSWALLALALLSRLSPRNRASAANPAFGLRHSSRSGVPGRRFPSKCCIHVHRSSDIAAFLVGRCRDIEKSILQPFWLATFCTARFVNQSFASLAVLDARFGPIGLLKINAGN
jgi:hypothetical protein